MTDQQSQSAAVTAGPLEMAGLRAAINEVGAACVDAFRRHFWFIAIISVYAALAVMVGRLAGHSPVVNVSLYGLGFLIMLTAFAVALTLGHTIWMTVIVRPKGKLIPAIVEDFRTRFLRPKRIAAFLAVVSLEPLFFSAFSSFKRMIPYYNFWHWDETFKDWDKWLHFGRHPWEWTHAVFDSPVATSVISFSYNAWYFVIFLTFIWQALSVARPRRRAQYLYSFIFTWMLLGTVLGTALASAGPVYYGRVVEGVDPYAPLMDRLYEINEVWKVWALPVQERLWAIYESRGLMLGSGISAMPSLHVATTTLTMILAWKTNKALGIAMTIFLIAIQIGSVHLGWHYAIDGYLSFALVLLIWFIVGRVLAWRERRQTATDSPQL